MLFPLILVPFIPNTHASMVYSLTTIYIAKKHKKIASLCLRSKMVSGLLRTVRDILNKCNLFFFRKFSIYDNLWTGIPTFSKALNYVVLISTP